MAQQTILALDIGHVRTGVARAYLDVKIASPLTTLQNPENLANEVAKLVASEASVAVVIGLPRNLNSDDTAQTIFVREQAERIKAAITVPVFFTDEALTSAKAEQELQNRKKSYSKEDIDMLSATYILEDFLIEKREELSNV